MNDLLRKGLNSEGYIRREYLRTTGDLALFISGIFPDSFEVQYRKTAYDLGYYIDIGRTAYDNLYSGVYEELSYKFPQVVDALNEMSVKIHLTDQNLSKYLNRRKQIDARTTSR